jgi:hypothetical protein
LFLLLPFGLWLSFQTPLPLTLEVFHHLRVPFVQIFHYLPTLPRLPP